MKKVIKIFLIIMMIMSFYTVCVAGTLEEAKQDALKDIESTFNSDYKGWEKDPEYKENPKYISDSDTSGIYTLYVRKLKDSGNSKITEEKIFLEKHTEGKVIEKAEGSGNVIHPGIDDPNWPDGCPNCSLKAGYPVYHEDARTPTCQCSKTESEETEMEEFKNRAGWRVIGSEPDTEYVDYTCNNKEVYGENAYESKITCKIEIRKITIEKEQYNKDIIEVYVAISEEQELPDPTEPGESTIEKVIVRASNYPVTFELYPSAEPELSGILTGDTTVIRETVNPGANKKVTCNITVNEFQEGNLVPVEDIEVIYDLYVIDFKIKQSNYVTDQITNLPDNVSFEFVNNLAPPLAYFFKSEDPSGRENSGEIFVGKNDFWLEVSTGEGTYSKIEHYVILDTVKDDGTKNVDFQILYTDNNNENVTDKEFIAKKPTVNLKLEPASDSIIDKNLNTITWYKGEMQIGIGVTYDATIQPDELNQQTEFSMIITPKDGKGPLREITHYAAPYSPVPWVGGELQKDSSLRIISVRDLRWNEVNRMGKKFYVNDSDGGDILETSEVYKNPIMGYGVEFNLNTDNHMINGIPRVNIKVGGLNRLYDITSGRVLDLGNYKEIKIKENDNNKQQGFLESYNDSQKLWSWVYYLPPIVGYNLASRPVTVGITFDIILTYPDGRTVNYKDWTNGWNGKAFTYNGQRSLLEDIKENQTY